MQTAKRGRELEASNQGVPERETAHAATLMREIECIEAPGLFASKATKQKFDERVGDFRQKSQAAHDASYAARRNLALGRKMHAKPDVHALVAVKRKHPGFI